MRFCGLLGERASRKTARLSGSKLEGVLSISWEYSTRLPNQPLCSWTGTSVAWFTGTSCGKPWYSLLGSNLEIIFATKVTMLRLIIPACTIPWLQPYRAHVGRIGAWNQQYGSSTTWPPWTSPGPVGSVGQYYLQRLLANMPQWLAAIIRARGGNTPY